METKDMRGLFNVVKRMKALPVFLKRMNIPMRMATVFIITSLIPLCLVTGITFGSSFQQIRIKTAGYLSNVIELKTMNAETIASKYESMMIAIAMSDRVQEDFRHLGQMDETRRIGARNGIEGYLFNILNSTGTVHTLSILPADGDKPLSAGIYQPVPSYAKTDIYTKAMDGNGQMLWSKDNDVVRLYPQNSLTLAFALKNKYDGKQMGVLVMCLIDEQLLAMGKSNHQLSDLGYSSLILTQGGRLLWMSPNLESVGLEMDVVRETVSSANGKTVNADFPGVGKVLLSSRLTANGWFVADLVGYADIMKESRSLAWITMVLLALFGGLSILLAFGLSSSVSQPMNDILMRMKRVEEGDLKTNLHEDYTDEFRMLSHGFNSMLLRIRGLLQETEQAHKEVRESELRALQAQINPHFLYNTLDSINWMANEIEADRISRMVTSLAKLFRLSLNKGKEETTLYNEFEHVRSYVTIQQMRFEDKFDVIYRIDEAICVCRTIKLILQPIVENSIYHGLECKDGRGTIIISGFPDNGMAVLSVQDDGVGMPEETVNRLFSEAEEQMEKNQDTGSKGYALSNVRQRLKLYYGESCMMSVHSRVGEGTTVTIRLPFHGREVSA